MFRRRPEVATPLDGIDAIFADLDGVVYKGDLAIPYAVDSLNRALDSGIRVGYITNNASRTDVVVAEHLSSLGLKVQASDVVTSPQAAASVLKTLVPGGATVLVIGGPGLVHEVERAGFVVTRSADDHPAAVVQGFAPEVGWVHLAEAAFALHDPSVIWVATNTDWTIPVGRGIAPGNGTLVSAVHTAVGRLPTAVAGKPEIPIFEEATRRFGASTPLFLGDRLDTDILGANRAGMASALVLTGIDQAKQVLAADASSRPTFILEDLRQLREAYPATTFSEGGATASVGKAVVGIRGDRVHILERGRSTIDLLRAGCAVIWNSGRAIYGLEVPESLYAPR